ncbi:hypothetical protein ACJX0J_008360, partial [Zea mays]
GYFPLPSALCNKRNCIWIIDNDITMFSITSHNMRKKCNFMDMTWLKIPLIHFHLHAKKRYSSTESKIVTTTEMIKIIQGASPVLEFGQLHIKNNKRLIQHNNMYDLHTARKLDTTNNNKNIIAKYWTNTIFPSYYYWTKIAVEFFLPIRTVLHTHLYISVVLMQTSK